MQGRNYSNVAFLKKYYGENIDNLLKLRQKRLKNAKIHFNSFQTLRTIKKSNSQVGSIRSKTPLRPPPAIKKQPQKKMFKKLSNQLKAIQESIDSLVIRRKKNQGKYKSKVITEMREEDPKTKIYHQVLNQIQEIKKSRNSVKQQENHRPILQGSELRTLFYGMDFIDGIQFKIKIQLNQQIYCLMAKNTHTKLMLEMSAKDYLDLQAQKLGKNPCNIFRYLTIENNKLKLKVGIQKRQSKSLKSYINYY